MPVQSLGRGDPLGEEMATHSSILACRIPWTEEHGGLQSMGSQRVGYDRVTVTSLQGNTEKSHPDHITPSSSDSVLFF